MEYICASHLPSIVMVFTGTITVMCHWDRPHLLLMFRQSLYSVQARSDRLGSLYIDFMVCMHAFLSKAQV